MLHNYFIILWRNVVRNKAFYFINTFGLSIGICTCLLIAQYVSYELSYDDFHERSKQLYRIVYSAKDAKEPSALTPPALGPAVKRDFPGVVNYSRINFTKGTLTYDGNQQKAPVVYNETKMAYADAAFLTLFSFPFLAGDVHTALSAPGSAVISASTAKKYFGEADPIKQVITLNNNFKAHKYTITGVFRDVPENSHLKFDVLFSLSTLATPANVDNNGWATLDGWDWGSFYTYLYLAPGAEPDGLAARVMPHLKAKYDWKAEGAFRLQALSDIHLYSDLRSEAEPNGNIKAIYFLIAVAVFILAIAWSNYLNLTTARATERAKEVGVRKVAGASQRDLLKQFLQESLLMNVLALIVAIVLSQAFLPYFNSITSKSIVFIGDTNSAIGMGGLLGMAVLFVILSTLLSGLYPAFVLSSFKPVTVLKGKAGTATNDYNLRRGLVILQFSLTLVLLIGTFTIYTQLRFLRNKDLGMDIEQLLIVSRPSITDSTYGAKAQVFKSQILQSPHVVSASYMGSIPGKGYDWSSDFWRNEQPKTPNDASGGDRVCRVTYVDSNFVETFQVKLLAGQNMARALSTYKDDQAVLINEAAAKVLAFSSNEAAIGQKISSAYGADLTVVGVIKNYHHQSLKEAYDPIVLFNRHLGGECIIRFQPGADPQKTLPEFIRNAESKYKALFPGNPFNYAFMDETFAAQYKADQQFGYIFSLFTGLAIVVACLGLIGLTSFTFAMRKKEIGVRKVLGASTPNIIVMLIQDVIKLIVIANLVAWPLAYVAINGWLENFSFRIPVSFALFFIPALSILLVAVLTICFQSWQAARLNPIKSLSVD